jgi:hypothetical protein
LGVGRQVVLKFILSHGLERMGMEEVLKELSREIEMAERGIAGKALKLSIVSRFCNIFLFY